ncbi:MAG: HlyD family secretion protein [Bacteroidales bacterium]|nr:HlyD family secretion protein [Bacteroidales bacterium]MCF8387267.1 HlyD family secretion protein [Bacteroidales bacterium]MCF8399536.1 HlyD family secretion protein [Bacteroidales bacterium]
MHTQADKQHLEEIMGPPPAKLISRGSLVIIVCLLIMLLCGFMIRSPLLIRGNIKIYREQSWYEIKAGTNACIAVMMVRHGEKVKAGQTLLVFEDQLKYGDFLALEKYLDHVCLKLQNQDTMELIKILPPRPGQKTGFEEKLQLIQSGIGELERLLFIENIADKKLEYHVMIEKSRSMIRQQQKQIHLIRESCIIQEKQMCRMDSLFRAKVIPEADLEKQRLTFLNHKQKLETACSRLTEQELNVQFLKKDFHAMSRDYEVRLHNAYTAIRQAAASLQSKLAAWSGNHLVQAPVGGRVDLMSYWCDGQHVTAGTALLHIRPDTKTDILGKLKISALGTGQLQAGQTVRIALENFPVADYGYVWGEIGNISQTPEEGQYFADVLFPHGLQNNADKKIDFKEFAQGRAEVILEDQSLMEQWLAGFLTK